MPSTATAAVPLTDEPDVAELYTRYHAHVVRSATRVVGLDAAHDVAQQLFLDIVRRGLGPGIIPALLPNLLWFQARRYAYRYQQRYTHAQPFEDEPDEDDAPAVPIPAPFRPGSPELLAFRAEVRQRLVQALLQLPPRMRQAVRLRFLHEQLIADVAQEMGVCRQLVDRMIMTARLRLRNGLADVYASTGHAGKWTPRSTTKPRPNRKRRR